MSCRKFFCYNYAGSVEKINIISINAKVIEKSKYWWNFSWLLVIENLGKATFIEIYIQFLDKDGFELDYDIEYKVYLPANKKKTFTSTHLLRDINSAKHVSRVTAKIEIYFTYAN